MAGKKFSEFLPVNPNAPIKIVGLQNGQNVIEAEKTLVYKESDGSITNEVINATTLNATTTNTTTLVSNLLKSSSGDMVQFEPATSPGSKYEVIHTGNIAEFAPAPATDHGALTGLGDNDHPQYALLTGASFSGFLRSIAPVNDQDVVNLKYLNDTLASGALRGIQYKWGNTTNNPPASGYINVYTLSGGGGNDKEIRISTTDANGYTRSAAFLLAGDTLILSTSPTAFARYLVLSTPTNNSTFWTISCRRTDTQGSQTPPPTDTVVTLTGTLSGTDVVEEYIPISQKGAVDGVAPLDSTAHIPSQYLNVSGMQYIGGWNAAPGILPPDSLSGDVYTITNAGTLLVVPPASNIDTPEYTYCNNGELIVYQATKDYWYLLTASTVINDGRYVQLQGSTMTGHLSVPAGASGSQVRQAGETDTLLALKAPLASPALTGSPTAPTPAAGNNTTLIANTAFVYNELLSKANLASPNFTGVPTAPNPTAGDSSSQIATTSFISGSIAGKADKTYVDSQDTLRILKAGDTYTGSLIKSFNGVKAAKDVVAIKGAGTQVGIVKINLPVQGQFPTIVLKGFDYKIETGPFEILIGGYFHTDLKWHSTAFVVTGNTVFTDIRVGYDSLLEMPCILLGTETTQLSYFAMEIESLLNAGDNAYTQSTIEFTTDISNVVIQTTNLPTIKWFVDKSYVDAANALKANIASPALTGVPTAPTATAGTNTTQIATTAFVIANKGSGDVVGPASSTDNYLAQWNGTTGKLLKAGIPTTTFATPADVALKADKSYVDSADALKAPLASPALTGTPTAPTASAGVNNTQIATTAYVTAADALKANLNSPALTGTPTAPTAATGTNTTQIATTAFVLANQSAAGGDVFGPANSTLNYIPQWADATGKLLKNGVPIQTSSVDITTGALMTVGAFGLGKGLQVGNADLDTLISPGLYYVSNSTPINYPGGYNSGLCIVVAGNEVKTQQFFPIGAKDKSYFRTFYNTWGTWQQVVIEGTSPKLITVQETVSVSGFGITSNMTYNPRTLGSFVQIAASAPDLAVFWDLNNLPANTTLTWSVWYSNFTTNPVTFYFQHNSTNTKCSWPDGGTPPTFTGGTAILTFTAVNNGSGVYCFAFPSGNNMVKQP